MLKCRDDAIRECETPDLPLFPLFAPLDHSSNNAGATFFRGSYEEGMDKDVTSIDENSATRGHPQSRMAFIAHRRLTETVPILPHWYIAPDSCLEQAFREHRVGQPCAEVMNDLKDVREVHLAKIIAFYQRNNSHLSDLVSVYAVTFFAAIVLIVIKHRRDMMRAMEQGTTSSKMTWLSFLVLATTYLLTVCTVSLSIPFWLVITFALTTFPVVVMLMFQPVHSKHDSTCCRSCETNADVNAGQTEEQACY